ncbi:Cell division control protein 11 [Cytospora mali]|uniref:Cell division control protein 11 n=1 Tax=Cytospora mali TaxID=578113 RepID=A0A194VXC1_CYTMA|nr:Cell division control protein 11 [Valsa mali]
MARIHTPSLSDDDFDLIPDSDAVSDVSDGGEAKHHQASPIRHADPGVRLAGPHEVPQMPYAYAPDHHDDGVASVTRHLSNHTIEDPHRRSGSTKESGDLVAEGLKYSKSVYNKFWGKDAIPLIAIMGMTGSGKTTFISKVTGNTDLKIGHDLTSCTQDIQVVEGKINGQTVRFVDTPGFSDTNLSDTEVLELIADYLAVAYKQKMKLSGIIYLHPITDRRVTHHGIKNLEMFKKLTGEANLKNVILATSMWDRVTEDEGVKREEELMNKFWKLLLAMGAETVRHRGTPESAWHIAYKLVGKKPVYLQLQEEMGKDNKALRDTTAGRQVMVEIEQMKEQHQRELADMENMMKNSAEQNQDLINALKEHYQGMLGEMQKTLRDERRMNEEAVQSLNDRIHALEHKGGCIVM